MVNQKKVLAIANALGVKISESAFRTYVKEKIVSGIGNIDGQFSRRGVAAFYPDCSAYEACAGKTLLLFKGYKGTYASVRLARRLSYLALTKKNFNFEELGHNPEGIVGKDLNLGFNKVTYTLYIKSEESGALVIGDAIESARMWLSRYIQVKVAALISGKLELHYMGEKELANIDRLNSYPIHTVLDGEKAKLIVGAYNVIVKTDQLVLEVYDRELHLIGSVKTF